MARCPVGCLAMMTAFSPVECTPPLVMHGHFLESITVRQADIWVKAALSRQTNAGNRRPRTGSVELLLNILS
jgi:hypothetical protein